MATEYELLARSKRLSREGRGREAYLLQLELITRRTQLWEPYHEAGLFSLHHGHPDRALEFFRLASMRETITAEATLSLAKLWLAQGHPEEALKAWSQRFDRTRTLQTTAALARFCTEWTGPREALEAFLGELERKPDLRYMEFCPVGRQGALPGRTELLSREPIPERPARFHRMPAPQTSASVFPPVAFHRLQDAVVRPHSDVVIAGGRAWIPDFIDLHEHLLYDTFTGRSVPVAEGELFAILRESIGSWLPAGILLASWASSNWIHFITEVLPVVALAERSGLPVELPLLISRPAAPQMLEFLDRVKAPDRPVEIIDHPTLVKEAIWFTPVASVPFEYLRAKGGLPVRYGAGDSLFSPGALAALKARVARPDPLTHGERPAKVYIDRNSSRRRVLNREQVLHHFTAAGYVIVQPERLSLDEQMALFSRASVIVGQSGAGLANLLFSPPGAQVVVLSGNPVDPEPHRYFPNFARALGHDVHYLAFGPPSRDLHIDFEVDLQVLGEFCGGF